jgi:fructose-1-phosphate kinase PfkB-like protein
MIKPNLAELGVLMESELAVPDGVLAACRSLVATGIETVFCSLGARGAIVASATEGEWQADAPTVQVVSTVGCGDATVAAYAAASLRGLSLPERIRWAMAAGAVCAVTFGPVMGNPKDVARMVSNVVLRRLDEAAPGSETSPELPESP